MYPDGRLNFLSKKSYSNFYKLKHDLKDHHCCLVLGAGASASVDLPDWSNLLKRICYSYFSHWVLDMTSKKTGVEHPPSNISIALTNSYEAYLLAQKNPELKSVFENCFDNIKISINGRYLSDKECSFQRKRIKEYYNRMLHLPKDFMRKIMSEDLTVVAQMIKNQVRSRDWNYLIRKSLYSSYEYRPYKFHVSLLYEELIKLITKYGIHNIINYNYDDTFYHSLKQKGLIYKNCYDGNQIKGKNHIFYPHGYIPMYGGVITEIVLSEVDYQNQLYKQNLWANNIQIALFSSNTNIFVGLSLKDFNIRRLLNMCSNAKCYMHYAFLPLSGKDQASIMCDSLYDADLYRLGIRVIRYSPENNYELLPKLIQYLCELL